MRPKTEHNVYILKEGGGGGSGIIFIIAEERVSEDAKSVLRDMCKKLDVSSKVLKLSHSKRI